MFEQLMDRYGSELDHTLRHVADYVPDASGLAAMSQYPLGWVDEAGRPYNMPTGKRVRPMFLLLCNEAAGGDWHQALYAAAAVELLHNFSLVHDDIQDNSTVRHNRPTVWQHWGIANAINAGDVLFSLSFVALHKLTEADLGTATVLHVWDVFNRTNIELTRGQHLDMLFETQPSVSIEDYISMITGKSAALLAACAEIGALIATDNDIACADNYAEYALNLGIAFQIHDDILGIWGDADITGKSTATDIVSRKKSLPVLYGLAHSEELAQIYAQHSLSAKNVERAVELLEAVDAHGYTRAIETRYYAAALAALDKASPVGPAADALRQFTTALFERTY